MTIIMMTTTTTTTMVISLPYLSNNTKIRARLNDVQWRRTVDVGCIVPGAMGQLLHVLLLRVWCWRVGGLGDGALALSLDERRASQHQ